MFVPGQRSVGQVFWAIAIRIECLLLHQRTDPLASGTPAACVRPPNVGAAQRHVAIADFVVVACLRTVGCHTRCPFAATTGERAGTLVRRFAKAPQRQCRRAPGAATRHNARRLEQLRVRHGDARARYPCSHMG